VPQNLFVGIYAMLTSDVERDQNHKIKFFKIEIEKSKIEKFENRKFQNLKK